MSFDSSRSANSGNKLKRNFNSISSNSAIDGNNGGNGNSNNDNNNKKKTTQQKTLGTSWGANSRSSSRSSFRNSPFSDVGSYMVVKNRKIQNQFDAEASSSSRSGLDSRKPIFHGVSIFVDGFTVPSSQELRGYMLKHGGRFENYFSRHHVTHIICSNLPDSKIKNLRSFSGGLPVVKPTWVLDSVAANKLLSWVPYQIDQLANESRNQPKLSAFFTLRSSPNAEVAANGATFHVIPEVEDSKLRGGTLKDAVLSEVDDSVTTTRQFSGESYNPVPENSVRESDNAEDAANRSTFHLIPEVEDSKLRGGTSKDAVLSEVDDSLKTRRQFNGESDNPVHKNSVRESDSAGDASNGATLHVIPEIEDSKLRGGTSKDAVLFEVDDPVKTTRQFRGESDNLVFENSIRESVEEPTPSYGHSYELKMAEVSKVDAEYQSSVRNEFSPLPLQSSTVSTASYCLDSKGSTVAESSNQRHSTLGDPNFVENYFKNSRLHFIGTWRNRYRKRFLSLSSTVKSTSSDTNSSTTARETSIIHVDMDCFFVSVVIRNYPELRDKPVAVCHSDNPRGTAEISSANYPARKYGVRAGIFVRDAKALCPNLVIFPYNFEAYEEVADQFYNILHKHCNKVQAVSCDEAFLEVAESYEKDPEFLASIVRQEIVETTGCTASAGIAGNMLMARLATRTAKPDGQCYIPPEKVDDYLCELPIKQLQGIGRVLEEKLIKRQVWTCGQLRMISKETLQKDFGMKTGDMLWNYSRGLDNRLVGLIQESKSIGAEVNWGVRFKELKDCQEFLINLCKEVSLRLQGCGAQGRTFTLKIKKRRKDAEEPSKYMGHGHCENLSHSMTVPVATDDVEALQRITKQLFVAFHIDVQEIRGVGLQVSRLENADTAKQGSERNSLKSWLTSASASSEELCSIKCPTKKKAEVDCKKHRPDGILGQLCADSAQPTYQMHNNSSSGEAGLNQFSELPPLSHLDLGVIESLPPELFSEINEMYGGKLIDIISKNKENHGNISNPMRTPSYERIEYEKAEQEGPVSSHLASLNKIPVENEIPAEKSQVLPVSAKGSSNMVMHTSHLEQTDLIPSSLSQVDTSVLQQLPEELRVGILEGLPAHRMAEHTSNAALDSLRACPQEELGVKGIESNSGLVNFISNKNVWIGNPPPWVDKFKASNSSILKILAEMYYRSGATGQFSSILQSTISEFQQSQGPSCDGGDEVIKSLSELLKQYIKLKMESDIEEIYVCFCLLKRFRMKSKVFLEVYNDVYPYLQASICWWKLWRKLAYLRFEGIVLHSIWHFRHNKFQCQRTLRSQYEEELNHDFVSHNTFLARWFWETDHIVELCAPQSSNDAPKEKSCMQCTYSVLDEEAVCL